MNIPQNTTQSQAAHSQLSPRSVTNRSRISNGRDPARRRPRLAIARRYRDLVAQIAMQGGADRCSEVRMQLIRRFASGAVLAEELEARLARGEAVDIADHALLSSTLVRLAQRIGINPRGQGPDAELRRLPSIAFATRQQGRGMTPIAATSVANCSTAWSKRRVFHDQHSREVLSCAWITRLL